MESKGKNGEKKRCSVERARLTQGMDPARVLEGTVGRYRTYQFTVNAPNFDIRVGGNNFFFPFQTPF